MNNQELISTIYAATLSPHRFDEMAADMEAQVIALVRAASGLADFGSVLPDGRESGIDPQVRDSLMRHVENALAIQARLENEVYDRDSRIGAMLDIMPNPAVVFDSGDRILRANSHATRRYGPGLASLGDLFLEPQRVDLVRKAVDAMRKGGEFATLPVQVNSDSRETTCILMKRIDGAADAPGALYLLTIVDFGFTDEVGSLFRDTFDLTDAETSVAFMLASGAKPAAIAQRRSVSLETVRAQIKAVKQKTGVRDIPDLVRLLCGFSTGVLVPDRFPGRATSTPNAAASPSIRSLRLADGRRMEYVVQGAAAGKPAILFHNMPYGQILPDAASRHAARHGLTVYAPVRPGCRGSDPLPGPRREEWLDAACRDTLEFMDRLHLARAPLLGNVAGSSFAIRFATLHPDRVSRLVLVSRAPIWRGEWLGQLPANHRLLSMLLWLMPKMADIFVGAIVSYMKKHSAEAYLRSAVRGCAADLAALDNPETLRLLATGVLDGVAQGGESFCRDWEAMEIDLTAEARALPHPIHVVHGADDRIIDPDWSREFARVVPAASIDLVENAGHYMFYSHWQRFMEPLCEAGRTRPVAAQSANVA